MNCCTTPCYAAGDHGSYPSGPQQKVGHYGHDTRWFLNGQARPAMRICRLEQDGSRWRGAVGATMASIAVVWDVVNAPAIVLEI